LNYASSYNTLGVHVYRVKKQQVMGTLWEFLLMSWWVLDRNQQKSTYHCLPIGVDKDYAELNPKYSGYLFMVIMIIIDL